MISKQKIIISGGFGHIGWQLAKSLSVNNQLYLFENNLMNRPAPKNIPDNITVINDDIKNIRKYAIESDLFFHFGEYSRVEYSINEPVKVFNNNIGSILEVVNYCHEADCKLIYSGSSTKFSDNGRTIYSNPYSFTKFVNSEIVREFCEAARLKYAVVYFNNVYGPGELGESEYATVVEKFLNRASMGKVLEVTRPGSQTRAFTHIEDTIDALLHIAKSAHGDGFVISGDKEYSIMDLARFISSNVELKDGSVANRSSSGIQNEKVKALGWAPKHDLFEYLQERLKTT